MVYLPAFTPEKNVYALIPISNSGSRNFMYASRQDAIISAGFVVVACALYANNTACSSYADPVVCGKLIYQLTFPGRLQSCYISIFPQDSR